MHPSPNTPFFTRCALTLTCMISILLYVCRQSSMETEGRHILSRNFALHFQRTISCYISGVAHVFLGCKKKSMGLVQLADHTATMFPIKRLKVLRNETWAQNAFRIFNYLFWSAFWSSLAILVLMVSTS